MQTSGIFLGKMSKVFKNQIHNLQNVKTIGLVCASETEDPGSKEPSQEVQTGRAKPDALVAPSTLGLSSLTKLGLQLQPTGQLPIFVNQVLLEPGLR